MFDLKKAMQLYIVTDRSWLNGERFEDVVEQIVQNGATMLQLREKDLEHDAFLAEALQLKAIAAKAGIPFVINDDVQLAKECDADGVHVGQEDMAVQNARRMLGEEKIIGVSASTLQEAIDACNGGADYLGVGAMFPTDTKADAHRVTPQVLKQICDAVDIPVVAIGGIGAHNIDALCGCGLDGVSVISAVFAAEDKPKATRELLLAVQEKLVCERR